MGISQNSGYTFRGPHNKDVYIRVPFCGKLPYALGLCPALVSSNQLSDNGYADGGELILQMLVIFFGHVLFLTYLFFRLYPKN